MDIIAIDPGTRNTGVVYMNERGVICAKTFSFTEAIKQDQYKLKDRAAVIAERIDNWIVDKPHELIVMEGFTAFAGRNNSNTFQTPFLCGYLQKAFENERIIIQTSNKVLAHNSIGDRLRKRLEQGEEAIPGVDFLTSKHVCAAAVHGWHYLKGQHEQ